MFKTTKALKAFISWAAANHVKRIKVDNVEIEISDIAFIPELQAPKNAAKLRAIKKDTDSPDLQIPSQKEELKDDPDLYWSTGN